MILCRGAKPFVILSLTLTLAPMSQLGSCARKNTAHPTSNKGLDEACLHANKNTTTLNCERFQQSFEDETSQTQYETELRTKASS